MCRRESNKKTRVTGAGFWGQQSRQISWSVCLQQGFDLLDTGRFVCCVHQGGRNGFFGRIETPSCRDGRNGFLIYTDLPVVIVMMLSVYQTVCLAASVNRDHWMKEWADCVWCSWRLINYCYGMWQRAGNMKFNTQNEKWVSIHLYIPQSYDISNAKSREISSQSAIYCFLFQFPVRYPPSSFRTSSGSLRLSRLPITYILPSTFPSVACLRRQSLRNMWPVQLPFLLFIVCRIFLSFSTPWTASAIRTGRLYLYSLSEVESTSGHMVASGGAKEKIPSDTTGNWSRDRPTSSAVP